MGNWYIALGGLFGAVGVALGAAGAHLLKGRISAEAFANFSTANSYLLMHAMLLVVCGCALYIHIGNRWLQAAGIFLITGMVLFSGGLIAKSITGIAAFSQVAPVGGSALILAWILVSIGGVRASGTVR